MGAGGSDVLLSEAALKHFNYEIECKNQEAAGNIYKWYDQAKGHGSKTPLLIIKRNGHEPLAVVDAAYFIGLHRTTP